MFRYTLTAWMLVLALSAPRPCCCSLARLAAMGASWATTGAAEGMQLPGCCQRRFASNSKDEQKGPRSSGQVPSSNGPIGGCKCERNLFGAVLTQNSEVAIERSCSWLDDLALSVANPLNLEVCDFLLATAVHSHGTPPAARSGREILVAVQRWLC
jgi:hypothetical protein